MSELKPCPFCGNGPRMKNGLNSEGKPFYQVTHDCMNLLSQIKTFCYETEPEAVAAWNRRVQPENSRQHALQTGVCPMCEDCPDGCPVETPKDSRNIVTNADRIRGMSDEELAVLSDDVGRSWRGCNIICDNLKHCRKNNSAEPVCKNHIFDWLQRPAETEGKE